MNEGEKRNTFILQVLRCFDCARILHVSKLSRSYSLAEVGGANLEHLNKKNHHQGGFSIDLFTPGGIVLPSEWSEKLCQTSVL